MGVVELVVEVWVADRALGILLARGDSEVWIGWFRKSALLCMIYHLKHLKVECLLKLGRREKKKKDGVKRKPW